MRFAGWMFGGLAFAGLAANAQAQDGTRAADGFAGAHVGAGVTAVDHHFVLEEQELPSGATRRFNVTQWGVGGQGFAGYDLAVSPRLLLGVEGAFDVGGRTAIERNPFYTVGIEPRHGFSVTARAGFAASPRVLVYAGAGYGGHDYRVIGSDPADADDLSHTRSFVLRGGGEYRLGSHVSLRAEFEHLDGTRNSFILGVPIRF